MEFSYCVVWDVSEIVRRKYWRYSRDWVLGFGEGLGGIDSYKIGWNNRYKGSKYK